MSRRFERKCSRWWAAGVASCMALASATHAAAAEDGAPEPRDEAAQHFEAARALYAQGDYELAAVELERAHALVPDPRVLYKLGKLWLHLQRHAQARRAFERYLNDSGAELSPDSRRLVESDLEQLGAKTAELELNVNVPGAEVLVDDVPSGHSPLSAPLVLDAGEHHIALRKDGYLPREARVTLAGNEARRLDVVLEPEPPKTAQAPSVHAPPARRIAPARPVDPTTTTPPTLTWVAWSVTGALAAGAASAGVLGLMAASDLDSLKDDPNASREALDDQAERTEGRLLAADILAGATLLAAGSALYFTLTDSRESPARPSRTVSVRISPVAVTLGTRF